MAKEYTLYKGSADKRIVQTTVQRELGPTEALVRHTHTGVCSTDLHLLDRGAALGHEGVGVVEELGSAAHVVSAVKVGDRVGMGWMQRYCGRCRPCLTGHDSLCENGKELWAPGNETGSFGTSAIWDVSALHLIPETLESKYAAPLMCAGATVWGAMQRCGVRSHHRVGVLGVGGLGHLAIQFLAKSGCEVVVISSSDRKRDEAMEYGADEYWTVEKIKAAMEGGKFALLDHLLICTGAQPDFTTLVHPLRFAPSTSTTKLTMTGTCR